MKRLSWLVVACWPLAAMGQAPAPRPEPAPDTLANIQEESEAAFKTLSDDTAKALSAKSSAQDQAAYAAFYARMQSLMDRALTLGRLHPGEPDAIAAVEWVAGQTPFLRGDTIAERGDAAYRLLADVPVLDGPKIALAILDAKHTGPRCPEVEPFLRSVISRSRQPYLVTLARYCLGSYLAEMARMHDRLGAPISGPELTRSLTKDRLDRLRAIDGPKLRSEAEALLEQVVREDADVDPGLARLGLDPREASSELYRIRHLRIGQPEPGLVGEDIDGEPLRLSDFRGKVVVLSFWPTLPAAYRLTSQEEDLVAAMKGRPFVLLGANVDAEDRAEAKAAAAKERVAWRSFWAGSPGGSILRRWDVGSWEQPTVYTIDADGIIRDDRVCEELTPAVFESLVHSAEEAAR